MSQGDHPLRQARLAAGLCQNCGNERGSEGTQTRCPACAAKLRAKVSLKNHDTVDDRVVLLNSPKEDEALVPSRRLACAILMQALDDLLLKGAFQEETKNAAKAFLLEENPDIAFWCRVAGIQLHHVQRAATERVRGEVCVQ